MHFPNHAAASTIETLIMPGPLFEGHAEYESDCSSCHVRFDRGGQSNLCRSCHEDIDTDLKDSTGFHGLSLEVRNVECTACHTDHQGRDTDIVLLDRETFDHASTDFPLLGGHRLTSCDGCHSAKEKFREAPSACIDCHDDDDVHRGNLGTECETCHVPDRWQHVSFDHDTTDFPLIGSHTEPLCYACHVNQTFENTPQNCVACHQIDDLHQGKRGDDCGDCHSPKSWESTVFDHGEQTGFALLGRHADLRCAGCHVEPAEEKQLDAECVACHRVEDEHKGKRGEQCDSCHTADSWREIIFEHGRDSGFELHNRHSEIPCESCHKKSVTEQKPEPVCYSCHRLDDPHEGQQGETCDSCHNDAGWHANVLFDHDLTPFPLIGLHATAPCEACHLSASFHEAESVCVACHGGDDVHEESLGTDCQRCHNPNSWGLWEFDHNQSTDFVLEGSHEGLQCAACHRRAVKGEIKLATTCVSCHSRDDVHLGRFGRNCERCHSVENFEERW